MRHYEIKEQPEHPPEILARAVRYPPGATSHDHAQGIPADCYREGGQRKSRVSLVKDLAKARKSGTKRMNRDKAA